METTATKRRDNKKSLRVKVISLGNAEVGKVRQFLTISHQIYMETGPVELDAPTRTSLTALYHN